MSDETKLDVQENLINRRQIISGGAVALGMLALGAGSARGTRDEEILRGEESIHQEPVFKASRKRVYEALTDAAQFGKVVEMSAAMKSGGMKLGTKAAEISREPGGAFSLFGGYISGRQVELVANERIVQAWRAGSWDPGSYSIARFVLVESGDGTKIVFDHTGFPKGQAEHLAEGWRGNYWEPLAKYLGEEKK
ncbi:MAG TPA: SRPBCC family protein [Candidatus Acidoferrum sp.]|nr:SRPBCC family protein [Candidatus Acidoferrum sp.]